MPGVTSPLLWGTPAHCGELFSGASAIRREVRHFAFRYHSPEHWLDVFRTYYGPVHKAFAVLDERRQASLEHDLLTLLRGANRGGAAGLIVEAEYLEIVITR
jgi:hypothetical protein